MKETVVIKMLPETTREISEQDKCRRGGMSQKKCTILLELQKFREKTKAVLTNGIKISNGP